MSSNTPLVIGAEISVRNSTELAAYSPQGLTLGTQVWNQAVDAYFKLTESTAALDPDVVVAVLGIDGWRWTLSTGGGPSLWLAGATQYVSPEGADANDGLGWTTAKKTIYAATAYLIDNGGGTCYFAHRSTFGGPVPGQGLWLRGDAVQIPGFLNVGNFALNYVQVGGGFNQYVFEPPSTCWVSSDTSGTTHKDAFHPDIWIVGTECPIGFHGWKSFEPFNAWNGVYAPVRLGWDYVRGTDAAIEFLNVTSASRVASAGTYDQTTYTVDVAAGAHQWVVSTMSRSVISGVETVRAVMNIPATLQCGPWTTGSPLHVVSSDVDFPSGNYTVITYSDVQTPGLAGATTIALTYVDGQVTPVSIKPVTATIQSHGCAVGDKVTTQFTNASFQSACMYDVTAVTWDTITVNDPYAYLGGGTPATGTDIGTVVKQIRGKLTTDAVYMDNCSIFAHSSATLVEDPMSGPAIDLGGASARNFKITNSFMFGGHNFDWTGLGTYQIDRDRTMVAILAHTGAGSVNTDSIYAFDNQSLNGSLRWHGAPDGSFLYVDHWLQDSGGYAFPTVSINDANQFCRGSVNEIAIADSGIYNVAVELVGGHTEDNWEIGSTYGTFSGVQCVGPLISSNSYRTGGAPSPWTLQRKTFWTGGIAAKHPGPNRANGVLGARYTNLFPAPAAWNGDAHAGFSFAAATAPDGSGNAVTITNASDRSNLVAGPYPLVLGGLSVGDYIAVGCWVNFPTTSYINPPVGVTPYNTLRFVGGGALQCLPNLNQPGWQWVTGFGVIATVGDSGVVPFFQLPAGGDTMDVYGATMLHIPAAVPESDAYELIGTMKHQPYYLVAGLSGTMEGVKLIGHGGLGVDSTVLATATGTGTIYKSLPVLDAVGAVQGYAPLYSTAAAPDRGAQPRPLANLGDATVTVNPASSAVSIATLPAATLTAARVLTLGVTGSPVTNSVFQVIRRDLTANTYTIKDDAGTTLLIFGTSPGTAQGASFYFDGTHFKLLSFYYVE